MTIDLNVIGWATFFLVVFVFVLRDVMAGLGVGRRGK